MKTIYIKPLQTYKTNNFTGSKDLSGRLSQSRQSHQSTRTPEPKKPGQSGQKKEKKQ